MTPNELTSAVQLSVNQVGPAYEGLELGVGDSLLVKAIAETTGTNASKLKTEYDKVGDLATVAESKRLTQKLLFAHANLTVVKVHSTFVKIAKTSGQQNKQNFIKQLMVASKGSEIRYIVRALQGKMRIGCNDATVLSSLAKAISFEKKESEEWANEVALPALKRAHAEVPNWSRLVEGLIQHHQHIERLPDYVYLTPGIPIKAMLAKPTKGIAEIMEKLKDFLLTLEFKYDGERAQFHLLQDGSFRVFSRNAEDNSGKFPDIFPHVRLSLGEHNVTSCILDSEIVAFDTVTQRILPFQTLSTRKRKDVDANDVQVEICVFVFDVLYLNGRSLLRKTLKERRDILHANVVRIPGRVEFAEFRDT